MGDLRDLEVPNLWAAAPLPVKVVAGILVAETLLAPVVGAVRLTVSPPDWSLVSYVALAIVLAVFSLLTLLQTLFLLGRSALAWLLTAVASLGSLLSPVANPSAWPVAVLSVISLIALATPAALRWAWADKPKPYSATPDLRRAD